jgi:acyl-homoserine lactone synthase
MIKIVTAQNADQYPQLMHAVWAFRHSQFVDRLGWRELASDDGLERDPFDTDDAIHLIALDHRRIVGYTRLLRSSGPHLLSEIYPGLLQGREWPRAPDIYEWTRCISAENAGHVGTVLASHMLITGVLEFCLVAGIGGLLVETPRSWSAGWWRPAMWSTG